METAITAPRVRRPPRTDILIAAAIAVIAQLETWLSPDYDSKALFAVAALAMCVPLPWRRVAPIPVLVLVWMPQLALELAGHSLDAAYIMLALLAAFYAVGAELERRQAVIGLAIGLGLLALSMIVANADVGDAEEHIAWGDFIWVSAILGGFWLLAVALRDRSQRVGHLEEHTLRLEREREERARAAVADERARIARELHDVVAHSVSVIAVQTGSMRRRLRHERPAEAEELAVTEQTARQALAEMRRLLGLLRADDDGLALSPQPGMDQVDQLVAQVRDTGLDVELDLAGDRRPLPPGVDLAAYRIVQEALTNVIKHAGPARARVGIRYGEREIELDVADDGRGPAPDQNGGGGHGLVGMRERVALYGGSFEAEPGPDGGFRIHARLPIVA